MAVMGRKQPFALARCVHPCRAYCFKKGAKKLSERKKHFLLTYLREIHIIIVPDRQQRVSVQALKHNSVLDSLVMWSFREGLCSETSSRSRHQPKENAQGRPVLTGRFSFMGVVYE